MPYRVDSERGAAGVARQDREADDFTVFVDAHRDGIERFIRSRLQLNAFDVEDLCSDVFVVALDRFDVVAQLPDSDARRWLLRVAELRCMRHLRRWRRGSRASRLHDTTVEVAYDPFDDDGLDRIDDHHLVLTERTREVLSALPDSLRVPLELDRDGFNGTQIAERIGASHGATRVRLTRGRRRFSAEWARRFGSSPWEVSQ